MEATTSRTKRGGLLDKLTVPESLPDDSEFELEALFELNMDAAYGELPMEALPVETSFEPEDVITENVALAEDSTVLPDKPAQNHPDAGTSTAAKPQERPKEQPAKARQKSHGNVPDVSSLQFTLASIEDEEALEPEASFRARTYEGQDLDKEAVDALLGGLTPFIANDHGPRADIVYPVALPLPSTTAADTSALREFRKDMRRRHLNQGNSRTLDKDLLRLLHELREGEGMQLQLPAICFELPKKQVADTPYFAEVASLEVDPVNSNALQLRCKSLDQKRETDFSVGQHNVPTYITDSFFFKDSKEREGSNGTVISRKIDLALSMSGRSSVADTADDEMGLAMKRNAVLDRLAVSKRSLEPNSAESRKKIADPSTSSSIEKMPAPQPLLHHAKRSRKPSTSR